MASTLSIFYRSSGPFQPQSQVFQGFRCHSVPRSGALVRRQPPPTISLFGRGDHPMDTTMTLMKIAARASSPNTADLPKGIAVVRASCLRPHGLDPGPCPPEVDHALRGGSLRALFQPREAVLRHHLDELLVRRRGLPRPVRRV